jgi:hypothetical protein
MYTAKNRLERATTTLQAALAAGTEKEKRAARKEHKAAVDAWEAACRAADEHYCGPCGTTHPMGSHGILVLKRAIAPDGTEFERSHDLHLVLCESEWKRLRIQDLIARQLEHEKE